jgi:hypothetical protein
MSGLPERILSFLIAVQGAPEKSAVVDWQRVELALGFEFLSIAVRRPHSADRVFVLQSRTDSIERIDVGHEADWCRETVSAFVGDL